MNINDESIMVRDISQVNAYSHINQIYRKDLYIKGIILTEYGQ